MFSRSQPTFQNAPLARRGHSFIYLSWMPSGRCGDAPSCILSYFCMGHWTQGSIWKHSLCPLSPGAFWEEQPWEGCALSLRHQTCCTSARNPQPTMYRFYRPPLYVQQKLGLLTKTLQRIIAVPIPKDYSLWEPNHCLRFCSSLKLVTHWQRAAKC